MNKQKYIYIFYLIFLKNLVAADAVCTLDSFLGKIFSLAILFLETEQCVCVCVQSFLSRSFFLVYSKLHINKLTTRTVILVRIYLIDTCAVLFSFYCSSFFATKCYLSFFFRVQPQKKILSSVCVCVYFSYDCSVRALFLSSIGDYLSLFFSFFF